MNAHAPRRVTANLSLTLDGRFNGPGGPGDLAAIVPYAVTDVARDQMHRMHENATTAVLGRGNAQGFLGFWPSVADDPSADPRDRGYAAWLRDVEKVVLSSSLSEAPWERARIVSAPVADVVTQLRASGEGDILVNTSPSLIRPLLAADLVDRLYLIVCPEISGGGERLLEDGLPSSSWRLVLHEAGDRGELALVYDRAR